ncbi:unnamed protein product, partial [marine sediment metagenome]
EAKYNELFEIYLLANDYFVYDYHADETETSQAKRFAAALLHAVPQLNSSDVQTGTWPIGWEAHIDNILNRANIKNPKELCEEDFSTILTA